MNPISGRTGKAATGQSGGMDLAVHPAMDGLREDLRGALRLILRSPAFAGMVILTLAVAIGATTSVFSVVRGLLLKPLPFREPQQLVRFYGSWKQFGHGTISLSEFSNDHEQLKSTSGVAAWAYGSAALATAGAPEHIGLGRATEIGRAHV